MVVDALGVALPDLDDSPFDRLAGEVEHAPFQMQHRTHGTRLLAAHLHQVVVDVGRKRRRIERPLGLRWRGDQAGGTSRTKGQQAGARPGQQQAA